MEGLGLFPVPMLGAHSPLWFQLEKRGPNASSDLVHTDSHCRPPHSPTPHFNENNKKKCARSQHLPFDFICLLLWCHWGLSLDPHECQASTLPWAPWALQPGNPSLYQRSQNLDNQWLQPWHRACHLASSSCLFCLSAPSFCLFKSRLIHSNSPGDAFPLPLCVVILMPHLTVKRYNFGFSWLFSKNTDPLSLYKGHS